MDKLENIKGIFLDLGGTLLYPPSGSFMFSDFAKRYFSPEKLAALPPEKVKAAKDRAAKERAVEHSRPVLSIEEEYQIFLRYYRVLAGELGLKLTDAELKAVADDKVNNKDDNYRLFDDTVETLKALRGKYRLGIISDTWPSIIPLLEHFDILQYFHCTTFSYELGTLKPDPLMFQDALSKMGLPAEQTVFVDDNPKNCEGAAQLGIFPVQICAESVWRPEMDKSYGIDHVQALGRDIAAPAPQKGLLRIDRISGLLDILDKEGAQWNQ